MSHFSSDELIFHKVGNEIISAGFGINSILLNQGLSPLLSFTRDYDTSSSSSGSDSDSGSESDSDLEKPRKKVFRSYKNLAIPIGLYLNEEKKKSHHDSAMDKDKTKSKNVVDKEEHIGDDIYDQLLKLIYYNEKDKRKSKKTNKKSKKSKTSKNKNKK
jgi:hypothetical protein